MEKFCYMLEYAVNGRIHQMRFTSESGRKSFEKSHKDIVVRRRWRY